MKLKTIRKWNRVLHRDIGYLAVGMSIIYGLSGIALNHLNDWNPSYNIKHWEIDLESSLNKEDINKDKVLSILDMYGETGNYKKDSGHDYR